jgi:transposase
MTPARATARRTSLEKHQDEVVALLLTGWTQEQVATKYKVNASSVHKFIGRHSARLTALKTEITRQTDQYAIAHQVGRVAELQHLYDLTRAEVDEYGIIIVETRTEKNGNTETVIVTRDYRAGLVKEARGILEQVADELGQKVKPDQNVNLRAQVLVRQVSGFDPRKLG